MKIEEGYLPITKWDEQDRPREKLLQKGKAALSDAELIGVLIGSGTRTLSAVELSRKILSQVDHDINKLAKLSVKDLMKFKGIGEAKAISIVSALELGRRRKNENGSVIAKITCSKDVYDDFKPQFLDLTHEEFWVMLLSRSNQVMKKVPISTGGVSGTAVDPKIIFKKALEELASGVIVAHNHPSGNLKPSKSDIDITKKLVEAGKMLEVPVLDHIIFTNNGYFSFADQSMI